MIKSICPFCNTENVFITWDITNVKCTSCGKKFHYLKIKHKIIK